MSVRCVIDVRRLPSTLPGTLVASETFDTASTTSWPSQWFAMVAFGVASQSGGKGRLQTVPGYKARRMGLTAINLKNVEVRAEFTPVALTESYPEIGIRQDKTSTTGYGDGYVLNAYVNPTTGAASFTLSGSLGATGPFNSAVGQLGTWSIEPYGMSIRGVEGTITGKMWKVSAGEASAVTVSITDTTFLRSGTVALAYNSGNSTDPGADFDNVKVYDLGGNDSSGGTTPPAGNTVTYSFPMTGANGAAMPTGLSIAKGVPPTYSPIYPARAPTIQSNKLVLTTGTTAAWSGGASFFVGDPNKPEGDATTYPPISSDGTWTWDMSLLNMSEQYPSVGFGVRGADLWPSGGGANQPNNSGYSFQLGVAGGQMDLIQNYNGAVLATGIPVAFAVNMKAKLTLLDQRVSFKLWSAAGSEPTAWNYDVDGIRFDQSDGNLMFAISNGPAAEQKTLGIANLVYTMPVQALDTANLTTVPPANTEPSGFTRITTASFGTAAAAGTGSGQFMNVYGNVFQPYADGGTVGNGAMYPSQMISAHDGVMDVYSDGLKASAGSFGSPTNAYDRKGGRFSIRMKAIGMFGNGPAFMIWPSDTAQGTWYFGELDFPESVSGRGGPSGFQDSPWIHHHKMVQGQEAQAQDVNLGASWRDWHTYTLEWYMPGSTKGGSTGLVIYYVDGIERYRTQTDVPSTVHRWCFQIGDWGTAGHIYINWYTMAAPSG